MQESYFQRMQLHSCNIPYARNRLYLLDERGELTLVGNPDHKVTLENAIVRIDGDASKACVGFLSYNRGYVGYDSYVVVPYDAQ